MSETLPAGTGGTTRRPRTPSGLFGHVLEELGQEIVNGDLPVGGIVMADKLCARFEVSRSVMRECLRALSSMGLVEGRPHVGTRVLPITSWDLLNPQVVKWRAQSAQYVDQMRQLLELRLGVEQVAARLAADRISPQDAVEIRQAALRMSDAVEADDSREYFAADERFHQLLLNGTGNPVIAQLAGTVGAALEVRRHDLRPGMHDMSRRSVDRHLQLADALGQRDAGSAQAAALALVEETLHEFEVLQSAQEVRRSSK
ncbi:MAG TPA: FCD domain-containing protein [Kribbella sp.]|uniref:FadR/GntR family transcriptional regulator n=1 Tax=Kribbella sp. TaxID=1871183 RepID=UPI002D7A038B|nr:FCD domain-containing protein [Kribbella sp.]HET6294462.1 FCD domain-containing protein [Kribbella sp.]